MSSIFDKYLLKKDKYVRRRIEIDDSLFEQLSQLTEIYDASINKLVNIAIIEIIKKDDIKLYKRSDNEIAEYHNFAIRESSYSAMEKMKAKYGLSIHKIVNIAIYNAINNKK